MACESKSVNKYRIDTNKLVSIINFVNIVLFRYYFCMSTNRLQNLLVCTARALQCEQRQRAVAAGLLPVQWSILSYLREANRYSNTPQALTEYLSMTKGTVSQSLKLLESRGWVSRTKDQQDRRMVRLTLTDAGRIQLGERVDTDWQIAAKRLPMSERNAVETALSHLLCEWQQARGGRTFGVCGSCRHFKPGEKEHRCGLTGEILSNEDSMQICCEHEEPMMRSDR